MKKGVNWIENQGENWYKMLKKLYVQVSLELNVIETNQFFPQNEGVNQIVNEV